MARPNDNSAWIALVFIPLFILWLALALVLSPILLSLRLFQRISHRRKYARHLLSISEREFFTYTSRENSRKYVEKHILPTLDPAITVIVLDGRDPRHEGALEFVSVMLNNVKNVGFPNVMKVVGDRVVDISLKRDLYDTINQGLPPERFLEAAERALTELGSIQPN